MELKDKIVVVTGATGGIGTELTKQLAKEGAKLILVGRTSEKMVNLIKEMGEGDISYFLLDFTQTSDIEELGRKIAEKADHIDILIHAAGVGVYKNIEDVEIKEFEDSISINVSVPFFLTKSLLPLLKKAEESLVINIGSGMGKIPTACRSVYCTTKFALRGMTLSLAEEFRGTAVHFLHIALGSTLTEFGPLTLQQKEEENARGKAYFTPQWVAKKFIEIIRKGKYEEEITLYPSDYTGKEWYPSK